MTLPSEPTAATAGLYVCLDCHRQFATAADLVAHVNSGHGRS